MANVDGLHCQTLRNRNTVECVISLGFGFCTFYIMPTLVPEKFNRINILLWVKIFFLLQPTEVVSGHYQKGKNWSVSHHLEDITLISLFNLNLMLMNEIKKESPNVLPNLKNIYIGFCLRPLTVMWVIRI